MITDEQVYDALLAFRMAQRSEKLTPAARLRGVLWTYGEPTPDDPLWEPMRAALRVAHLAGQSNERGKE